MPPPFSGLVYSKGEKNIITAIFIQWLWMNHYGQIVVEMKDRDMKKGDQPQRYNYIHLWDLL